MWYFRLTAQENAIDCFGGLVDKEVDLQFLTWQGADLQPANSGKSFNLTSNGTKSDFAGLNPVVQKYIQILNETQKSPQSSPEIY